MEHKIGKFVLNRILDLVLPGFGVLADVGLVSEGVADGLDVAVNCAEMYALAGGGAPQREDGRRVAHSSPPPREPHRHYLQTGARSFVPRCDVCGEKNGDLEYFSCESCNYDECSRCFDSGPSGRGPINFPYP